jgi:hypothetical protein
VARSDFLPQHGVPAVEWVNMNPAKAPPLVDLVAFGQRELQAQLGRLGSPESLGPERVAIVLHADWAAAAVPVAWRVRRR